MVWGRFAGSRVGGLDRLRGTLNQNGYCSILQDHAVPSGVHLVCQGFIIQQDNDPKPKSKFCRICLRQKEQDDKLENVESPAQFPDLNPSSWFGMNWTEEWKQSNLQIPHIFAILCNRAGKNLLKNIWFPFPNVYFHFKNATNVYTCYIWWLIWWVNSLEYILVNKLIPWFVS